MVIYAEQPTPAVLERTVAHRSLATRRVINLSLFHAVCSSPQQHILALPTPKGQGSLN